MPTLRTRYDYTKIYRPNGTRYAEGKGITPADALDAAYVAYEAEFGARPPQCQTSIEIFGITGQWVAQVFDVDTFIGGQR